MFRCLLVPLDGSRLAEAVLPLVERFATAFGAKVMLLHVLERGAPTAVHGEHHLSEQEEATAYLEGVTCRLRTAGVSVEYHTHEVREGDVARSVVSHAG